MLAAIEDFFAHSEEKALEALAAPEQFETELQSLLADVMAMAPRTLEAIKRSLNEIAAGQMDIEAMRAREALTVKSQDFAEGRLAFQDKHVMTRFEAEEWHVAPGAPPAVSSLSRAGITRIVATSPTPVISNLRSSSRDAASASMRASRQAQPATSRKRSSPTTSASSCSVPGEDRT